MTEITWFKRFHGTAYDPKFTAAAVEAGSTHCNALGVWDALLETTSENDEDRGSLAKIDFRVVAAGLHLAIAEVQRIWDAFVSLGMIAGERIAKWAKRQGAAAAKLAQGSMAAVSAGAERTRKWRAKKKPVDRRQLTMKLPIDGGLSGDVTGVTGDVTGVTERHRASPIPSHSTTDSDLDRDTDSLSSESDARARPRGSLAEDFAKFWEVYPHRVDELAARKAFALARREVGLDELIAAVRRYCATKPVNREWCNPTTWLRGKRWLDQPAAPGESTAPGPRVVPRPLTEEERQQQAIETDAYFDSVAADETAPDWVRRQALEMKAHAQERRKHVGGVRG